MEAYIKPPPTVHCICKVLTGRTTV